MVVLGLAHGVQLDKISLKEEQKSRGTRFPPSSHRQSASGPLSLESEGSGTFLQMCSSFLRCSATKDISTSLELDCLTLRSSSLFFAVVVVFSHSAFISLSFSPRKPFGLHVIPSFPSCFNLCSSPGPLACSPASLPWR